MYRRYLIVTLLIFFSLIGISSAELYQIDNLVYDSTLDVTWLTDANYIVTSGYIDTLGLNNGFVTWSRANTYAEDFTLNGYSDWRLPADTDNVEGYGAYGELGALYYTTLGNAANAHDVNLTSNDATFTNVQRFGYWTNARQGTSRNYWTFSFANGASTLLDHKAARAVWLVHDGNITGLLTWQGNPLTWQGELVTW